jgi:hypothetical protein
VDAELNTIKQLFGEEGSYMESGTIMASYLSAFAHGASKAQFHLPSPDEPLKKRVTALVSCLEQLRENRDDLLLLSSDWIKSASRIRQRVLTQGSEDDSFYQNICGTLDQIPYTRAWGNEKDEKAVLKREIYTLFPFSNDGEERYPLSKGRDKSCVGPGRGSDRPSERDSFIGTRGVIEKALERYVDEPRGSWKRGLYEMKDEVIKLINLSHEGIVGRNVYILRFTRSPDLWEEKVLLGAPVASVTQS